MIQDSLSHYQAVLRKLVHIACPSFNLKDSLHQSFDLMCAGHQSCLKHRDKESSTYKCHILPYITRCFKSGSKRESQRRKHALSMQSGRTLTSHLLSTEYFRGLTQQIAEACEPPRQDASVGVCLLIDSASVRLRCA